MTPRLLCFSLGCLVSACGAPAAVSQEGSAATPVVPPASSSAPAVSSAFVPLGPPTDMAPAGKAPGPTCKVSEHVLGRLADPKENLFPIAVVADAQGALAAWMAPGGLTLQRLDAGGAPAGAPVSVPGSWPDVPTLLLTSAEAILLFTTPAEITVARVERTALRPLGVRRFPRPDELSRLEDAAADGPDLWLIGTRERDLLFLRVGREGPLHHAVVQLPRPMPADLRVTMGHLDGSIALLISTLGGDTWLASERGTRDAAPGDLTLLPGRFVRPLPIEMRTGATGYGLQTIPAYPLSRSEDARLQGEKGPEAFHTRGTYGLPGMAWTGTHFLYGEARGAEGKMDELSVLVSAVDCRGEGPR